MPVKRETDWDSCGNRSGFVGGVLKMHVGLEDSHGMETLLVGSILQTGGCAAQSTGWFGSEGLGCPKMTSQGLIPWQITPSREISEGLRSARARKEGAF